jgi:CubicO group peptidase (beta-lactamase class C family)
MKNTIYIFFLGVVVPLFLSCNAQQSSDGYDFREIDSLFQTAVENQEIPGAVALIAHHNKILYQRAFGYRNIAERDEQKANDIFRLASMTKALTAAAILQLQEQDKLHVHDYLHYYLPEFKDPQILLDITADSSFTSKPALSDITIHQLLIHTSGIGYGFQNDDYNALIIKNKISEGFGFDERTSHENIRKLAELPLLHEPGEVYTYGLSYDVLGVLIEVISGQRLDEYITEKILIPCGMHDSYFIIPEDERYRLPSVYQPGNHNRGIELSTYRDTLYPCLDNRQFFSGGADLCSTAKDYFLFLKMLSNSGSINGHRILQPQSVDAMLSKQTELSEDESYQGYAAWIINAKGACKGPFNIGTYGFGGFFDTYSWTDPTTELSAVLLLQMYPNNTHRIHEKFQNLIYEMMQDDS